MVVDGRAMVGLFGRALSSGYDQERAVAEWLTSVAGAHWQLSPELRALPADVRWLWDDAATRTAAIVRIAELVGPGGVSAASHAALSSALDVVDQAVRAGLAALGVPPGHARRVRVEAGPVAWAGKTDDDGTIHLSAIALRAYVYQDRLPDAVLRTWVHELLHGRQPSAPTYRLEYTRMPGYEEGMVEGLARSILRRQGIEAIGGTFDYFVAAYRALTSELGVGASHLWRALWDAPPGGVRTAFTDAIVAALARQADVDVSSERLANLRTIADTLFEARRTVWRPDVATLRRTWRSALR